MKLLLPRLSLSLLERRSSPALEIQAAAARSTTPISQKTESTSKNGIGQHSFRLLRGDTNSTNNTDNAEKASTLVQNR
ncbi:hypothetical protein JZ751_024654 [Albula glossodonta]|uniref:Uncharacterized protein n=1 Tax=Albula glossodonta TaxID=121402 RepID=A0A8T2PE02_9TELE|nr:hypothetical protein JZ751_024654 [Albula glossodonta]